MPSELKLALILFGMTLVVPLWVWGMSASWRTAWHAWKQFAAWMGALYLLGGVVALFTWLSLRN